MKSQLPTRLGWNVLFFLDVRNRNILPCQASLDPLTPSCPCWTGRPCCWADPAYSGAVGPALLRASPGPPSGRTDRHRGPRWPSYSSGEERRKGLRIGNQLWTGFISVAANQTTTTWAEARGSFPSEKVNSPARLQIRTSIKSCNGCLL